MYDGPGHYQHYKGGEYEVLGLAVREETKPEGDDNWNDVITEVVYRPLIPGSILPGPMGQVFWTRRLEDFNAMVMPVSPYGLGPFRPPEAMPPLSDQALAPVPRFQKTRDVMCLYFGATGDTSGHRFIWGRASQRAKLTTNYPDVVKHLPWDGVDGKLTPPGAGQSEAALLHKDGWTALAWVNRLFDTRPGSNSAFFFNTTLTYEQCIEEARKNFPHIIKRHEESGYPIKLYEEPTTRIPS